MTQTEKYEYSDKYFPHAIIHNFFSEQEVKEIWKELEFLTNSRVLLPSSQTAAATENNVILKQNNAVFIDNVFAGNRQASNILTYFRRFWEKQNIDTLVNMNQVFKMLPICNQDVTLMSYYENSDYYKPHWDNSVFTILIHFFKEPKQFGGGDLFLGNEDYVIPNESNRLIIFPGYGIHGVTPIVQNASSPFNGMGRYTLSHFLGIKLP
jgi:Rps23 Pro-64 3,4-dihydroxylase Tpa1-like proline 4-hydroxylase